MFELIILYEIKLFSVHRWKDEQEGFLDADYSFSDSSKFPHIDNEGCQVCQSWDNPDKQRPSSCFLGYVF